MIIAITGGSGFIGRRLVARHLACGDQVRFLTRGQRSAPLAGAEPVSGSLTSPVERLREFTRGADVLYHCAAELHNEADMQATNVAGTANLIAAAAGEIGRWVQLSSTGVYGRHASGDIREDSPVNPANAYESSKLSADRLVYEAAAQRNLPCVVLRPSNVYGVDMANQSLFQLIRMIDKGWYFFIGPPGATANYVHVENVVDALLLCATSTLPDNARTYIVSDGRTLEELVPCIAAALNVTPPRWRLPAAPVRALASVAGIIPAFPLTPSRVDALTGRATYRIERIRAELGYENKISLETGMREMACFWKGRHAS